MFLKALAATAALIVALPAIADSSLDKFSSADRAAIERAAPDFVREVKTGQIWDLTIHRKYRRLETSLAAKAKLSAEDDRDVDLLGLIRPVERKPTGYYVPYKAPTSRFKVSRLAFGRAWAGDHFEDLTVASTVESKLNNVMEPAEPIFPKIKVNQALSTSEAIVTCWMWAGTGQRYPVEQNGAIRLRGFDPGVDGEVHQNIYAEPEPENFSYTTVLGAKATISSWRVVKPKKVTRSSDMTAEELAEAILAGKAKLTAWQHQRTTGPKSENGKPTIQVEWVPEDVTPKPMVP